MIYIVKYFLIVSLDAVSDIHLHLKFTPLVPAGQLFYFTDKLHAFFPGNEF